MKYEIPRRALTQAIEGLQELAQRLETDAANLARLASERAAAVRKAAL